MLETRVARMGRWRLGDSEGIQRAGLARKQMEAQRQRVPRKTHIVSRWSFERCGVESGLEIGSGKMTAAGRQAWKY